MKTFEKIKKALQYPILSICYLLWINESHAQFWEDKILEWFMLNDNYQTKEIPKGFYIDIWWNHPSHWNNTYFFYRRWWHGITVEPNKDLIKRFQKQRPRDLNLQLAIWEKNEKLTFYSFDIDAVSTCDTNSVKRYKDAWYKIIEEYEVEVWTLESIFSTYAQQNQVEILSVDVEWLDLKVLQSNDRDKYRPTYVIVETVEHSVYWRTKDESISKFMTQKWYKIIANTWVNTIFKNAKR